MRAVTPLTIAATIAAALLSACGQGNQYVAPPPPKVTVATPVQQPVTRYLEATGKSAAVNSADLVARVAGLRPGDQLPGRRAGRRKGTLLFTIEPESYRVKLEQAKAAEVGAEANLKQAQATLQRQTELLAQPDHAPRRNYDQALAARDSAQSTLGSGPQQHAARQDQLRLYAGHGAVRRHRHGAAGFGRPIRRRHRDADGAGDDRAARSDLREFQRQRARRPGCPRRRWPAAACRSRT